MLLFKWNEALGEHPPVRGVTCIARRCRTHLMRASPRRIIVIRLLPAPWIEIGLKFLICGESVISSILLRRKRLRRVGFVLNAFPRAIRIDDRIGGLVRLKYET